MKSKKCRIVSAPTQLPKKGQWWSIPTTQLRQVEQWCDPCGFADAQGTHGAHFAKTPLWMEALFSLFPYSSESSRERNHPPAPRAFCFARPLFHH